MVSAHQSTCSGGSVCMYKCESVCVWKGLVGVSLHSSKKTRMEEIFKAVLQPKYSFVSAQLVLTSVEPWL